LVGKSDVAELRDDYYYLLPNKLKFVSKSIEMIEICPKTKTNSKITRLAFS